MADSLIGSLRVLLGVDTAAFSEGLTKAEKQLASFSKNFSTIAAGAAVAVASAGVAIGIGLEKSLAQADQLGKMAQKFGIPIEELSKLKFAAELSDVSIEALGKGLGKLSKALTEAAAKPTSEAANAFKALGISVRNTDGSVKSSEQALLDIADKFSELKDGAGKTAIAIALFGRAGADLIPLLNQGAATIKKLKKEAEDLGLTISESTAKSAERFNDNMKRLNTTWQVVMLNFAAGAAGPLADISEGFVKLNRESSLAKDAGEVLASIFKAIIEGAAIAAANIRSLANDFKALFVFIKEVATLGPSAAFANLTAALAENVKQVRLVAQAFKTELVSGMDLAADAGVKWNKTQKDINYGALAGKDALNSFLDSTKKATAGILAQSQTVGLADGQLAFLKTTLEAISIAEANSIVITNQRRDAIIAAANAAGTAADRLAAAQAIEAAIPEYQKLEDKIVSLQSKMARFPDLAEGISKAVIKTQLELTALVLGATASAVGGFADLFMELGKTNKKLFEVGKAFAIAQAIINTAQAVTKTLAEWGWPLGAVFAAGAVAAGAAQILKIQSTQFKGAALGGTFKVPGGISGVDSKLVPMMLSPGERVDITPSSKAGSERSLVIQPIKPKDMFSGETVREMVFAIDQWMRDGGTGLKFAR